MTSESITALQFGVNGATRIVGVFGYPVAHSLSPAMHNAAFAALQLPWIYVPFPVAPAALETAVRSLPALGIVGVNLTIPHKEAVLPFLDTITDEARDVGAVNTVHCVEGRLVGDNTDGRGFYAPLREQKLSVVGRRVVVLGAGGAARSVVFQLAREGANLTLTNRTLERAAQLARDVTERVLGSQIDVVAQADTEGLSAALRDAVLLVQTTRVGMFPESDGLPDVPFDALHPGLLVYDLVYNPLETRLLQEAKRRGCPTLGGVAMLAHQGALAFERWTGVAPPIAVMETAVLDGLNARRFR